MALFLCSGFSYGREPCVWQVARDPRLATDVQALRMAEQLLVRHASQDSPLASSRLREALRILERADAAHSPDPRVRFLYGRLLTRSERHEQALRVLSAAIDEAPDHPSVADALFSLAICHASLGRTQEEIAAYQRLLQRQWVPERRSIVQSNLAESLMFVGRIEEAIQTYREAIATDDGNILARWGLAVALDRAGDSMGAFEQVNEALVRDPLADELDNPLVFFVPAYDRFWYFALWAMSRAHGEHDALLRADHWQAAAQYWQRYIEAAPAEDRWVAVARVRLVHRRAHPRKGTPR